MPACNVRCSLMRGLMMLTLGCAALMVCIAPVDRAEADGLRTHVHAAHACRPPPWFRGLQDVAPFVCGSWWGWPQFYYQEFGPRHRRHHRDP
jgi:hypothetical protein